MVEFSLTELWGPARSDERACVKCGKMFEDMVREYLLKFQGYKGDAANTVNQLLPLLAALGFTWPYANWVKRRLG